MKQQSIFARCPTKIWAASLMLSGLAFAVLLMIASASLAQETMQHAALAAPALVQSSAV